MDQDLQDLFAISSTVLGKEEWRQLEKREDLIGPEQLLAEILEKRLWSNVEIIWVLKRLVYFYGKKDSLLKKMPVDRMFVNMVDVLRAFFLIFDQQDPDLDDNMRAYISSKLADSTWGINQQTRRYLHKVE